MSSKFSFKESKPAHREPEPIWRGIGFIILAILTIVVFYLSGFVVELPWVQTNLRLSPALLNRPVNIFGPIVIPGRYFFQFLATVMIDLMLYAIMVIIYSFIDPIKPGEKDAPPVRRKGPKRDNVR